MELEQIIKIFGKNLDLAFLIYKDKFVYANQTALNILGLTNEEILQLSPKDIIADKQEKTLIEKISKKRINGELPPKYYDHIQVINKNSEYKLIKFFTQTIQLDDNSYAGLVIGEDVTYEKKKETLLNILSNINKSIIMINNEEELYEKINNIFFDLSNFNFVCISLKNQLEEIIPKYFKGNYEKNLLSYLPILFKLKKFDKNEIIFINDLEKSNFNNKDILLKQNFKSALFIPITKNNDIIGSIEIFTKYRNYFDKKCIEIFKQIKNDIEYSLNKIETYSYLTLLKEALNKSYSWVIITDENANILYANKSVEEITKYKLEELIGKNPKIFKSGYYPKNFYEKIWEKLKNNEIVETILINKDKNGELFYLKDKLIPVTTPDNKKYFISLATDITHEEILKQKLKKDPLTNLPNRQEFINQISKKINNKEKYAFIIIDIKDFKIFNQINGMEAGDYILKHLALFLKSVLYKDDYLARIKGDAFCAFVKYNSLKEISAIINKIINGVNSLEEFHNKISLNFGISLYPKDGTDINDLIEKAFLALKIAKEKGEFAYEFFSEEINKIIIEYAQTKTLLKNAIKYKEFIYHFQPYIDSKTLKIAGAETLLRINHDNKIIYPNSFIDYAENSGYIKEIEKIMFPKFLEYLKQINLPLSFNISGKSLTDEEHIKNLFKNIENLPINIELTEREIAGNIEYTKKIFDYFKNKNFKLSIDDFGTGYSSFNYLKDLPADYLKIDISFVKDIENSKKNYAVVETIIDFAHKFNMKTIAEGVENINQFKLLQNANCDYIQGFYFYKPMPFDEFKSIL